MEKLLSSSSSTIIPFQNHSPFLPRLAQLARFDSSKLSFSSSTRSEFKRVCSISCNHENPSPISSDSSSPLLNPSSKSIFLDSSRVDSVDGPSLDPQFLQLFGNGDLGKRKAIAAGTVILLSALVTILIHPIIAPPAYATFQTAAKTGGTVAAAVGKRLLRTEVLSSAWAGFFAGCLHTLSGPDHLAALAPLSIGCTQMESAAVGVLWGCGHDAGQVIFGLIFLLLKDQLHIEIIRTWGTVVVGFTLLAIGVMGIKEASEASAPYVALESGDSVSVYEPAQAPTIGKKKIGFTTFATGIVHGLQPDALMMVLPALALPSRWAGAAYLGTFLIGTVFAMGSYTVFLSSCSQALKERVPRITEKLTWASSLVAIGLGLAIIISQFFGYGLY